jgi:hypothetical protein
MHSAFPLSRASASRFYYIRIISIIQERFYLCFYLNQAPATIFDIKNGDEKMEKMGTKKWGRFYFYSLG